MSVIIGREKMGMQEFLMYASSPEGQKVLVLFGSGVAAAAAGVWVVIKFFFSKSVYAKNGSIAAGGNIHINSNANDKNSTSK